MGIWDTITNDLSGGGKHAASAGYDEADSYMDPYRRGGMEDYNSMRDYNQKWQQGLGKYSDAGNSMYDRINMAPGDYYAQIMGKYSESPMAKYEQEQAMRASNAAGASSGMIGSGAQMKALQQNAAGIAGRDQDRYYNNVMTADNHQMGYLQNLQGQQAQQRQMMQYLTQLGYGAAGNMGENAINRGKSNAQYDQSGFDDIMAMIGAGGSAMAGRSGTGGAGGGGGGGNGQMPEYMMKAIQMAMMAG